MSAHPDARRRELLEAALRNDLVTFTQRVLQTVAPGRPYDHNWHLDLVADRLERWAAGDIPRLAIALPPRSLKSIMVSVALPAMLLGLDPTLRIICVSYDSTLAEKHARDCLAVMSAGWYRALFPQTRLDRAKNAVGEFTTTKGGYRLATSVGGPLTGRGGNLIIVDDPLKAGDTLSDARRQAVNDWFSSTLISRLDDKERDAIIVVAQRLHPEDLIGHLLASGGGWQYLALPAIADDDERFVLRDGRMVGRRASEPLHAARESLATLEAIRSDMGSWNFAAQYQQNPRPLDGGMVSWGWFRFYETRPERRNGDLIVQSWDTASKPDEIHDFSVCTTWLRRGEDHYLLDVDRGRYDYPTLKRHVVALAKRWQADAVLIEDRGSGIQLIQDLRAEGTLRPVAISPVGDKLTRMFTEAAKIEAGHVLLPTSAPWLAAFQDELLTFPRGRHDDQVDSLSQALAWRSGLPVEMSKAYVAELETVRAFREDPMLGVDLLAPWDL